MPVAKSNLQVFTFGEAWGLPTAGPFGLKLEACLRILGVSYDREYENDNRKGPKRKSPWIEEGDVRMGDTELILEYIERAAMGRADVDALADWLGDREWFVADRPTKADASAFGLLAVSIRSSLPTPTCTYARSKPNLVAFVDRSLSRFFPRVAPALATS